jgi:CheY-like chemotaxis protein
VSFSATSSVPVARPTILPTRSGRVLVVDDNTNFAENIAEILQVDGWSTDVVGSAEEALPRMLVREPNVVITDYRLPGMNGADFVRGLRLEHPAVIAVVISAYSDERTIEAAIAAGAAFLGKPLDFAVLCRLIDNLPAEGGPH